MQDFPIHVFARAAQQATRAEQKDACGLACVWLKAGLWHNNPVCLWKPLMIFIGSREHQSRLTAVYSASCAWKEDVWFWSKHCGTWIPHGASPQFQIQIGIALKQDVWCLFVKYLQQNPYTLVEKYLLKCDVCSDSITGWLHFLWKKFRAKQYWFFSGLYFIKCMLVLDTQK